MTETHDAVATWYRIDAAISAIWRYSILSLDF